MDEGIRDEQRLLIGDLVLDVGLRQVSRGTVPIELPKLSFRLLHALAMAAPDVLTQDELIERVWPGRVISPETLTQRVKLLRHALGDDAKEPRYVGLVRGQGYRLLADVRPLADIARHPARLLVDEIVRRNVLGVALIYAAVAWALARGFVVLAGALPMLPQWAAALFASTLITGFPLALWLTWRIGGSNGVPWAGLAGSEGRLPAVVSLIALVGTTVGLGWLIYPAVPPPLNTLAVMPFENLSGNVDDDYLSEGVADELRNQLGRIADLRVVGRRSSISFRSLVMSEADIAERLAVSRLVTGTLQSNADGVRVTVEIVDGATGIQIWNNQYEAEADGLLAVQGRIVNDVAMQFAPSRDGELLASALPTGNEAAYSLMLIGNKYFQEVLDDTAIDKTLLGEAIAAYRRAVDEDPSSALAHSQLGAALIWDGRLDEAEGPIRRAEELDANLSRVQHTLGLYLYARREDGVAEHYARAVALNPNNVQALEDYALLLWAQADTEGARTLLERALEIDRMSIGRYETLGNFYGTTGYYEDALALADEILRRFDDGGAYVIVARIYELTGDLDEAIGWAEMALARDPANNDARWKLAELYARIGDTETARRYDPESSVAQNYFLRRYEDLIDQAAERLLEQGDSPVTLLTLAQAYNATGRYEATVRILEHQGVSMRISRDSHSTTDVETALILTDALKALGRKEEAVELAAPLIDVFERFDEVIAASWHPDLNLACLYSILDDDERSLQALERMIGDRGMPWYPRVRDQPCFREKFDGNPRYQAVLDALLEQKRQLRERLPATLDRFRSSTDSAIALAVGTTTTP